MHKLVSTSVSIQIPEGILLQQNFSSRKEIQKSKKIKCA
jgi:hypothetical protein